MVITKKILKNQSGVSLVAVTAISGVLIGSIFYLYDQVSKGIETVEKYNDVAKSSLGLRGVMAYAKDLLDTRSCIDASKFTGLPEFPCKLTDAGSLERLLISKNVSDSLCNYYTNNGKPNDGLQNYCGTGKPPLALDKINFKIKKSTITNQHLIYSVFDDQSDYSLKGSCLLISYESAMSSLHAGMATITTRVKLHKDDNCEGEVIASGEAVDVFFPRQMNEFTLITNRSISIGNTSKESDINILDSGSKITFHSPVFVNKNLYFPTTGFSSGVKTKFADKIIVGGEILSTAGNYPEPVYVGTGEIWMSKHPSFAGFQKGLFRAAKEKALQTFFDPTLAPVNDTSYMDECNAFQKRKYENSYCSDSATRPRVVFREVSPSKYEIGLTKLGEFTRYNVSASNDTKEHYSNGDAPNSSRSVIEPYRSDLLYGDEHFLAPNENGYYIQIDMLKNGILRVKGGNGYNNDCFGDILNDGFEYCYDNNDDELSKRIVEANPYDTDKFKQDKALNVPNDEYVFGEVNRYTKLTCDSKDCEIEKKKYRLFTKKQDLLYFKIAAKVKKTDAGNSATQVYKLDLSSDTVDPKYFEFIRSSDVFKFAPNFTCQRRDLGKFVYTDNEFRVNYQSATLSNGSSDWRSFGGSSITLSTKEADYLEGKFTYQELCNQAPTPAPAYASYDADWTGEAFNSWNYNPVDKSGAYKPNPAKTGYDKIFNLTDTSVTNQLVIDNTSQSLFHSKGIVDRCIIKNTATIVKGFLICRYLHIEQRSSNLEMIGTFIVDKLTIEKVPSSYEITWKNIYHPTSREKLVDTDLLLPSSSCTTTAANPAWARISNRCDPSFLAEKAVPFTWTTFDPLCVIISGSPVPLCKPEQRGYNFNIQRLYEHYGI